jgi:IS5 family transposase
LADALASQHKAITALDDVHALIDWEQIEGMLSCIHANKKGEHAWPPLLMFKAMLLQSWYNLSNPKSEEQLARDLLFRRLLAWVWQIQCRITAPCCVSEIIQAF